MYPNNNNNNNNNNNKKDKNENKMNESKKVEDISGELEREEREDILIFFLFASL